MKPKKASMKVQSQATQLPLAEFTQLAYGELRAIAGRYFKDERPDHTLQPTALVHEAFIRLADHGPETYENRAHFFSTAARAMREILVDYSRAHNAEKRGNGGKVASDDLDQYPQEMPDYPAIDSALKRFAATHR